MMEPHAVATGPGKLEQVNSETPCPPPAQPLPPQQLNPELTGSSLVKKKKKSSQCTLLDFKMLVFQLICWCAEHFF